MTPQFNLLSPRITGNWVVTRVGVVPLLLTVRGYGNTYTLKKVKTIEHMREN